MIIDFDGTIFNAACASIIQIASFLFCVCVRVWDSVSPTQHWFSDELAQYQRLSLRSSAVMDKMQRDGWGMVNRINPTLVWTKRPCYCHHYVVYICLPILEHREVASRLTWKVSSEEENFQFSTFKKLPRAWATCCCSGCHGWDQVRIVALALWGGGSQNLTLKTVTRSN